ncbi:b(0,+)-type amino acid transporter 1-like [Mercenaria mercenaria]|uniref:b(0,+)-type amino acid transporter 1-like n=1 Tax=Mercenaria mercenaria TaxID=6596 RepID=UPI00234EAD90|nr:b(0,+)-type amino acid transporter 1-like [Mercenaria mercenaria]
MEKGTLEGKRFEDGFKGKQTRVRRILNGDSIFGKSNENSVADDTAIERKVLDTVDGKPIVIETDRIQVKERIGLAGGISFVMGAIIGSGIFISPKGALQNSGSIGLCLLIWALCGILSMILGLVYAELGVMLPKSGGDYTIIKTGIGRVPAFLVSWTKCIVSPGGSTVQALVFADYVCAPIFGKCGAPNSIRKSIAAAELLILAITNTISVRLVSSMQGLFTVLKVMVLVIIIVGGFVSLFEGKTENFNDAFQGSTNDVTSISLAIYSCMWAYSGYTNLNEIAEELIQPKKNIPRAIVLSMTFITMIYMCTNVSYFTILSKSEFLTVSAVAYSWGEKILGTAAIIIPIGVMCSVHGNANGGFFTEIRVRFAAARAGHLPEVLSFLHHKSRIPLASLFLNTLFSLIFLIPGDVGELINLVSFVGFLVESLTFIAYFRIRYQRRKVKRNEGEFRIPLFIPVIALAICAFMLISPFVSNPRIEFLYGVGFILSGLVLYIPFVHLGWSIPGTNLLTMLAQLLWDICPTILEE